MNDPLHDVTNSVVTQLRKDLRPRQFQAERKADLRARVKDAEERALDSVAQLVAMQRHLGRWFSGIAAVAFVAGVLLGYRLA